MMAQYFPERWLTLDRTGGSGDCGIFINEFVFSEFKFIMQIHLAVVKAIFARLYIETEKVLKESGK